MRRADIAFVATLVLLLPLATGCGARPDLAPVSGTVTLDGQPLADAHVSFQPVQDDVGEMAMGSYGTTAADGSYRLRLVDPDAPGATAGMHRVRIHMALPEDALREDSPLSVDRLPVRYRDGTLTFQVPAEGTESADFHLTSQ